MNTHPGRRVLRLLPILGALALTALLAACGPSEEELRLAALQQDLLNNTKAPTTK